MGRPTYLIAKYVPDLFRNEPINVGVILWIGGRVGARFLSERNGKIDLRAAPSQIVSKPTYKQWVSTWRKLIESDSAKVIGTPQVISKADPGFLDAIKTTGQGNYVLEKGGQLLEDVKGSEFTDVLDYLFERLIEDRTEEIQNQTAKEIRDDVLREGKLNGDPRVISDKMVPCTIGNKTVHHEFHIFVGNGIPAALGQVIPLTDRARSVKKTAESFAYRFESAQRTYEDQKPKCLAFVYNPDHRDEGLVSDALVELEHIASVIDITKDRSIAVKVIREQAERTKLVHS